MIQASSFKDIVEQSFLPQILTTCDIQTCWVLSCLIVEHTRSVDYILLSYLLQHTTDVDFLLQKASPNQRLNHIQFKLETRCMILSLDEHVLIFESSKFLGFTQLDWLFFFFINPSSNSF